MDIDAVAAEELGKGGIVVIEDIAATHAQQAFQIPLVDIGKAAHTSPSTIFSASATRISPDMSLGSRRSRVWARVSFSVLLNSMRARSGETAFCERIDHFVRGYDDGSIRDFGRPDCRIRPAVTIRQVGEPADVLGIGCGDVDEISELRPFRCQDCKA
ncbi:hypothetical protein ACFOHS_22595, partial [Jhaorihella thermophila]